jgi:uncharacterized membrane protein
VDCFFHSNVPAVARCGDCGRSVCATCRDDAGTCPSCRLAARIDAAAGQHGELPGGVRSGAGAYGPHPGPSAGPAGPGPGPYGPNPNAGTQASAYDTNTAIATVSPETRALVALGYPIWPLAALALLDPKRSRYVRRQATQAMAFSFGYYGFAAALEALAHVPILGMGAWPIIPLLVPLYVIAVVVYGWKAWQGQDVRVPLISDWLDQRWPEDSPHTA